MYKFRTTVEAVQITDATFDGPHPSEDHILGVMYDPQQRCAFIQTSEGMQRADIGDWIVRDCTGKLSAIKDDVFQASHAREQAR
jgi:hypothetical protein